MRQTIRAPKYALCPACGRDNVYEIERSNGSGQWLCEDCGWHEQPGRKTAEYEVWPVARHEPEAPTLRDVLGLDAVANSAAEGRLFEGKSWVTSWAYAIGMHLRWAVNVLVCRARGHHWRTEGADHDGYESFTCVRCYAGWEAWM